MKHNKDSINNTLFREHPENTEPKKVKSRVIAEMVDYLPDSTVSKTILNKSRANISVMSFDTGEGLTEKTFSFNVFVQIIEGKAEIGIDTVCRLLVSGQGIIIPADTPIFITPDARFKMIQTSLKTDTGKYSSAFRSM